MVQRIKHKHKITKGSDVQAIDVEAGSSRVPAASSVPTEAPRVSEVPITSADVDSGAGVTLAVIQSEEPSTIFVAGREYVISPGDATTVQETTDDGDITADPRIQGSADDLPDQGVQDSASDILKAVSADEDKTIIAQDVSADDSTSLNATLSADMGALAADVDFPSVPIFADSNATIGTSSLDKGKAKLVEEDTLTKKMSRRQMEEDRLGEEAAKRLHDD